MFSVFIESIKAGKEPDLVDLRKRFDLAIVKKMGVLSLPYHFWQSDNKINPSSAHMLMAATYLEDQEGVTVVAELMRQECEETQKFKKAGNVAKGHDSYEKSLNQALDDLLALSLGTDIGDSLKDKCLKAKKFLGL